jgi:hypothetical protein
MQDGTLPSPISEVPERAGKYKYSLPGYVWIENCTCQERYEAREGRGQTTVIRQLKC